MERYMEYHHYDVVRTERRNLSEGVLPVNFMAEFYKAKAEDERLVFSLTAKAFFATCGTDKTEVTFFAPLPFLWQNVAVMWGSSHEWWLELQTCDKHKNFFLESANTKDFVYQLPPNGAKVIHYVIG